MPKSLIKRGVLAVAAVAMASAGVASAANVTVENLFSLSSVGLYTQPPKSGYQDVLALDGQTRGILVNASTQGVTSLYAGNASSVVVNGISGTQQVGVVNFAFHNDNISGITPNNIFFMFYGLLDHGHAYLWDGTTANGVDLHPAGEYMASYAFGTDGIHQVGGANWIPGVSSQHAMLWSGTAASAIDLSPAISGYGGSIAVAVRGDTQGGLVINPNLDTHAVIWHGTAESCVDLHPDGYFASAVTSLASDGQYGYAWPSYGNSHAMKWDGTAESAVDLHPANTIYNSSYVTAASDNGIQIGIAVTDSSNGFRHAVAWLGSAESFIDLSALLNETGPDYSVALGIDGNDIYGLSYKYVSANGSYDVSAVKWTISTISGDTNLDGVVDITDYNKVINNFGGSGLGDTNSDGVVDVTDFNSVINNFGLSEAMAISLIPEPTSFGLLGIGAMGLMRRRRV